MRGIIGLCLFGLSLTIGPVHAADPAPASLTIQGNVRQQYTVSAAELAAMPPETIEVGYKTQENLLFKAKYTGVSVWTLLAKAGLKDDKGKYPGLRHVIEVRASDDYFIMMSMGELDPAFGNLSAIIAYAQDGKPLDAKEGLRLVIGTDRQINRFVRNVAILDVK